MKLVICLFLIAFQLFSSEDESLKVKIGFTDYVPYSWHDKESNTSHGFEVDLVKEIIEKKMKLKLSIVFLPWKRVQGNTYSGLIDGYIATKTEERAVKCHFNEEEFGTAVVKLYYNQYSKNLDKLLKIDHPLDAKEISIGSLNGHGWTENIFGGRKGYNIQNVSEMDSLFQMLALGRIDAVFEVSLIADYYVNRISDKESIKKRELKSLEPGKLHFCLNKKSPFIDHIKLFDKLLKEMKVNGEYEMILKKYGISVI